MYKIANERADLLIVKWGWTNNWIEKTICRNSQFYFCLSCANLRQKKLIFAGQCLHNRASKKEKEKSGGMLDEWDECGSRIIPIIAKRDDKYGNKWYEKIFYFCVVSFYLQKFLSKIKSNNKVRIIALKNWPFLTQICCMMSDEISESNECEMNVQN